MNPLFPISSLALAGVASGAALFAPTAPSAQDVAIQAGRIYLVEDGAVIENGTVLVRGGRIVAVGEDVSGHPPGLVAVEHRPEQRVGASPGRQRRGLQATAAQERHRDEGRTPCATPNGR